MDLWLLPRSSTLLCVVDVDAEVWRDYQQVQQRLRGARPRPDQTCQNSVTSIILCYFPMI